MNSRSQRFLESLATQVLVGDGAFGTLLYSKGVPTDACLEALCLTRPDDIATILREYKDAGARVLETNSFCLNRHKLLRYGLEDRVHDIGLASAKIAREVAGETHFVAGSLGPIVRKKRELDEYSEGEIASMFREAIGGLVDGGIDVLILETFSRLSELEIGLRVAREFDVPVLAQMAFAEDGLTDAGISPERAAKKLTEWGAHGIGANCQIGPKTMEAMIERLATHTSLPVTVFPNAGYAQQVDGRYVYGASPEYFGQRVEALVRAGATLLGGCCGTGPEHIRAIATAARGVRPASRTRTSPAVASVQPASMLSDRRQRFLSLLDAPSFVTVEIEPPRDFNLKKTFDGARELAQAGCDAFNIPDNPLAVVRMDNMVFAQLLRQAVDLPTILHLTCRDKNAIALKSDLLGAQMVGIESILAVTGDPAAIGDQPGASSVYDLNSIGLVEMISALNARPQAAESLRTDFAIGVALNANASGSRSMEGALSKLQKKIEAGAHFVETQPLFDPAMIERLLESARGVSVPICLGIMPIVSERNAEFLHNEIPGIRIPKEVRARFHGLDRRQGEEAGLSLAKEWIDVAWQGGARRFYIVPPFSNFSLVAELVRHIRGKWAP